MEPGVVEQILCFRELLAVSGRTGHSHALLHIRILIFHIVPIKTPQYIRI